MVDQAGAGVSTELSFEEAYERLEETVRALEAGGVSIDELVLLYERGVALAGLCNDRLDAAELRVTRIAAAIGGSAAEAEAEVLEVGEPEDVDEEAPDPF